MSRKLKAYLAVIGGGIGLFAGMLCWSIFGPAQALIVSRETTYLTSPLTSDGEVDYVGEILRRRQSGVSAENNAAIPLLLSTWPGELSPSEQSLMCKELGFNRPTADGLRDIYDSPYYHNLITEWASKKWGVDLSDSQKYDFDPRIYLDDADTLPWRRDQLPPLAKWVDSQKTNLDRLHGISRDSKFNLPAIQDAARNNAQRLSNLDRAIPLRSAARALFRRANMYAGEHQPQQAWNDLRIAFLLSRLLPNRSSGNDVAIGSAIQGVAIAQLSQLISYGDCDGRLLDEMKEFFADLEPFPTAVQIAQDYERPIVLYSAAYDFEESLKWREHLPPAPGPNWLLTWPYDRNAALQRINQVYDRVIPILQMENAADFAAAAELFEAELTQNSANWNQWRWSAVATLNQSARGVYVADVTHAGWSTANFYYKKNEIRTRQQSNLLLLTIALAKYHVDHGEYPPSLHELGTRIDPALLEDVYLTGALLRYERRGDGFLLYSRFIDGTDDGGDSGFDIQDGEWLRLGEYLSYPGDDSIDLVVRFPIPTNFELEKPLTRAEEDAPSIPTDE